MNISKLKKQIAGGAFADVPHNIRPGAQVDVVPGAKIKPGTYTVAEPGLNIAVNKGGRVTVFLPIVVDGEVKRVTLPYVRWKP